MSQRSKQEVTEVDRQIWDHERALACVVEWTQEERDVLVEKLAALKQQKQGREGEATRARSQSVALSNL